MNRSLYLAWLCGAAPLLTGTAIYLAWLVTNWDWLIVAGGITLYAGVAVFAIGCIALARYCWLASSNPMISRRRLLVTVLASAGVLLANFPAAGGILLAVISKETAYTVRIENLSSRALLDARVVGGGVDVFFGDIQPKIAVSQSMWFGCDGNLTLTTKYLGELRTITVEGYVTGSMGGSTTVFVDEEGAFTVIPGAKL